MPSLREFVIDSIRPLLPATWRLIPYATNLDDLDQTVVMVSIQSIERFREAPQSGQRTYNAVVSVFSPLTEAGRLDTDLDDSIQELLDAMDAVPNLTWTDAKRVIGNNDQNFGFDITVSVPYIKEN